MKKVFKLKKDYYDKLVTDPEFEHDIERPYYVIRGLDYKGGKIAIGIPLRSNINKNFISKPDEYVATPPSDHTLSGKGNIAGWHVTKMIPLDFSVVVGQNVESDSSLLVPFAIANDLKNQELVDKAKKMLSNFENGTAVFGSIDFDGAIEKLGSR